MLNKSICFVTAVALSLATFAAPAQAQYPERNITLIVPYAAGGGTDVTARMLARDLEAELGKPVTVENRAGGGGWVGWGALAQLSRTATPSAISMCRACMPAISTLGTNAARRWKASRR